MYTCIWFNIQALFWVFETASRESSIKMKKKIASNAFATEFGFIFRFAFAIQIDKLNKKYNGNRKNGYCNNNQNYNSLDEHAHIFLWQRFCIFRSLWKFHFEYCNRHKFWRDTDGSHFCNFFILFCIIIADMFSRLPFWSFHFHFFFYFFFNTLSHR